MYTVLTPPPPLLPPLSSTLVCLQGGAQSPLDCCAEYLEGMCVLPAHVGGGACNGGVMVSRGGRRHSVPFTCVSVFPRN